MRIAINTRFLLKDKLEGIGWYTYEVVRRLVEMRPDDEFIFLFDRPYDPSFIFGDNVEAKVLYPPARHPFLWYLWFEWAVPRALRQAKADVFFSPDSYCNLRSKVPTLMTVHDIAFMHFPEQIPTLVNKYYRYFEPRYIGSAQKVSTVSSFTAKDMMEKWNIPKEKIQVDYNGCKSDFEPILAAKKDETKQAFSHGKDFFLFVGAFHPRKNVHRIIKAFDSFKKATGADVQLVLGGRFAWQTGVIKDALEASPYKDEILLPGYITSDQLPALTASALAMVYPSHFEGFGLPVLEAMQSGVPVITSNVSSLPEVAGDAALLVDPNSVEQIADAMIRLYQDPELRQSCIEKGLVQSQRFSWDKTAVGISRGLDGLLRLK